MNLESAFPERDPDGDSLHHCSKIAPCFRARMRQTLNGDGEKQNVSGSGKKQNVSDSATRSATPFEISAIELAEGLAEGGPGRSLARPEPDCAGLRRKSHAELATHPDSSDPPLGREHRWILSSGWV